jgi:hypothetical protein
VAVLLDGYVDERHKAAYLIAIEWRRLGVSREDALAGLKRWAKAVGITKTRELEGTIRGVWSKHSNGQYRWHPPGLKSKGKWGYMLQPTCDLVGCPQNCPAFSSVYGAGAEDFKRFCKLGWPEYMEGRRLYIAPKVYRAICVIEEDWNFRSGAPLHVSHQQIAKPVGLERRNVSRNLPHLAELELIAYTPGSGSGPNAKDRIASEIARMIPIPSPPVGAVYIPAITTGDTTSP